MSICVCMYVLSVNLFVARPKNVNDNDNDDNESKSVFVVAMRGW